MTVDLSIDPARFLHEELAQASFLIAAGCDEAQGYWYGRPMTAEATGSHLRGVRDGRD